jgi:hypothetical protein
VRSKPTRIERLQRLRRNFVWITKVGKRELRLPQITDQHLANILNHLEEMCSDDFLWKFEVLKDEANRRKLKWKIIGQYCDFPVDSDEGSIKPCGKHAVTYTFKPHDPGHARCETHRPDKHIFVKRKCDGCFQVKELVFGLNDEVMFCRECSSDPEGEALKPLWAFLTILVFLLTLGVVYIEKEET